MNNNKKTNKEKTLKEINNFFYENEEEFFKEVSDKNVTDFENLLVKCLSIIPKEENLRPGELRKRHRVMPTLIRRRRRWEQQSRCRQTQQQQTLPKKRLRRAQPPNLGLEMGSGRECQTWPNGHQSVAKSQLNSAPAFWPD